MKTEHLLLAGIVLVVLFMGRPGLAGKTPSTAGATGVPPQAGSTTNATTGGDDLAKQAIKTGGDILKSLIDLFKSGGTPSGTPV